MINKIISNFKKLDSLTYKIMKKGLTFCFFVSIIATAILVVYNLTLYSPTLYYIGLSIFKLSCIFSVEFIICGLIVDSIKKQLI